MTTAPFRPPIPSMALLLAFLARFYAVKGLSASKVASKVQPWATLPIEYSAANEFIAKHYEDAPPRYFGQDSLIEDIYNAREGIIEGHEQVPCSLVKHGMELVAIPAPEAPFDWNDMPSMAENYLPALEEVLLDKLGTERVKNIYFWNPTIRTAGSKASQRDEDYRQSKTPVGIYASMAHIDSDVNAYETVENFLKVVENNIVPGTKSFPLDEVATQIEDGRLRFGIINAWRGITDTIIRRSPLAVRLMRYELPYQAFPLGKPDFANSHWYTFPDMTPSEVLLFMQYDRDATHASDLWHCALKSVGGDDDPTRVSLDVRAFVVFKELVSSQSDRLAQRTKSLLSLQESADFCSQQAKRLRVE